MTGQVHIGKKKWQFVPSTVKSNWDQGHKLTPLCPTETAEADQPIILINTQYIASICNKILSSRRKLTD